MTGDGPVYYKYNYYNLGSQGIYAQGYYWSASSDGTYTNRSKYLWFGIKGSTYIKNSATTGYTGNVTETVGVNNKTYIEGGFDRQIGMCVRLVWDAN